MVIAVDFDGTLCKHAFPEIGEVEPVHKAVADYLKLRKAKGDTIILWTCREDLAERKYLTEAVEWCKDKGIPIDFVNEYKLPQFNGFASRKICADLYIDDKAVNVRAFERKGEGVK
jgi:hypothetical protein